MVLQRSPYIAWATRYLGCGQYNLASSGIPPLLQSELDALPSPDSRDGWEQLLSAIAKYHCLSPSEVAPVLGASHGLWLGYTAMLRDGDEVLVEDPAYEPLVMAAEAAGATVRRFDRGASCGFALDPERVFAALTPRTRIVAITNLHNPSGIRASEEAMRVVARRMDAQRGFLFVDEVYAPFDRLVGSDGVFFATARRLGHNIVTTASLTKAYGLGPHRIGWVLGPETVIEQAIDALVASVGDLPIAWMNRGVWAFEHVVPLAERSRSLLGTKRARVREWISGRSHLAWSDPQEGLFGLAMVQSAGDVRSAIELGLERHDVLVVPGSFFGIPNAFRLGWTLPESLLDEALGRLDCVLRDAKLV